MDDFLGILFDKKLVSDLRFIPEKEGFVVWSKRSKYKIFLPVKVNRKVAYLTGVIMGNGNISVVKRKVSKYPVLILRLYNASKDYLNFLNEGFYEVFGIKGKLFKKKDKNCYVLTFNQKWITLYFLKIIGLSSGKKTNLRIPRPLRNKVLFKHFLAGLFDTDGYLSETFGIMMYGSNYDFLEEISMLLNTYYGISSRKLWIGTLYTETGAKPRSQLQIKSGEIGKFINVVPLKHHKYGPVV